MAHQSENEGDEIMVKREKVFEIKCSFWWDDIHKSWCGNAGMGPRGQFEERGIPQKGEKRPTAARSFGGVICVAITGA